jgi:hypothetical protein
MRREMNTRRSTWVGVALLALLTLGPLLVSGHTHSAMEGMDSCNACRLANHTPVTVVVVVAAVAFLAAAASVVDYQSQPRITVDRSLCDGRAPPRSPHLLST